MKYETSAFGLDHLSLNDEDILALKRGETLQISALRIRYVLTCARCKEPGESVSTLTEICVRCQAEIEHFARRIG